MAMNLPLYLMVQPIVLVNLSNQLPNPSFRLVLKADGIVSRSRIDTVQPSLPGRGHHEIARSVRVKCQSCGVRGASQERQCGGIGLSPRIS